MIEFSHGGAVGNSGSKGIAMLQLNWLRQLRHARRLGFVRSLKRRSLNSAPSAEILESKCVLSAINMLAQLSDDAPVDESDDSTPMGGDIAIESEDLTDWKFKVCDFLMVEDGEVAEESGEVIDGGLADEFETVDSYDPESGEQIKVIYYFGMSGGIGSEKGDDSEVEVTDLEAIDGYVDDVTLMQKEDYVVDDFVTSDDTGAAESGPSPILFRNFSFGGVMNFSGAIAPVADQTSAPAAAASTALSNVVNSVAIPVASGSNNSPTNLFATQNVISAAPVFLAQLNDAARQDSVVDSSDRSLNLLNSADEHVESDGAKSGSSSPLNGEESSNGSSLEDSIRASDLKKVDAYLQQIGDEANSESGVTPATETSCHEGQNANDGRTADANDNGARQRRQGTDNKIAESVRRTAAIRAAQKQTSETEARKHVAASSAAIRPV